MRLRQTFLDQCRWLWTQCRKMRDLLRHLGAKKGRNVTAGHAAARARFWDGVREGQREAAARCSERER